MRTDNLEIRHVIDNGQSPLTPRIEPRAEMTQPMSSRAITMNTAVIGATAYKFSGDVFGGLIEDYGHRTGDVSLQKNMAFLSKGARIAGSFLLGGPVAGALMVGGELISLTFETIQMNRERERQGIEQNERLIRSGGLASNYARTGGRKL